MTTTTTITEARARTLIARMDALVAAGYDPKKLTQDPPGEYDHLEWELGPLVDDLLRERGIKPDAMGMKEARAARDAEIERLRQSLLFTNLLDTIAAAVAAGFTHTLDIQALDPELAEEEQSVELEELALVYRHGGGPQPMEGSNQEVEDSLSGGTVQVYELRGDHILCNGDRLYRLLRP